MNNQPLLHLKKTEIETIFNFSTHICKSNKRHE